jgi:hypothetical protein
MAESGEVLENHSDRLIEAEGRIFALTYIVNQLLTLVDHPDAAKSQIEEYRAKCEPKEDDDEYWVKFKDAVRHSFGQMISGAEPTPPTRPTFTVITGGKKP